MSMDFSTQHRYEPLRAHYEHCPSLTGGSCLCGPERRVTLPETMDERKQEQDDRQMLVQMGRTL